MSRSVLEFSERRMVEFECSLRIHDRHINCAVYMKDSGRKTLLNLELFEHGGRCEDRSANSCAILSLRRCNHLCDGVSCLTDIMFSTFRHPWEHRRSPTDDDILQDLTPQKCITSLNRCGNRREQPQAILCPKLWIKQHFVAISLS
jgi:hypothetical protein